MMQGSPPHQLHDRDLLRDLGTKRIGRQIIVLPEVGSTNSYALDVLATEQGADADGCVVFAEQQAAGRGRLGRTWHSPRGASLLFTGLLWEDASRSAAARFVMAAGVAVLRGIEQATDVTPVLRWPNDIYVGEKKLAGILVEVRSFTESTRAVAIGIGVNCLQHETHFPPDIRRQATSLDIEASHPVDRVAVARAILRQLDEYLGDSGAVSDVRLANDWRAHSADLGARVTLGSEGREYTGRIVDVNPHTGLLVQLDTGGRREFDPATTTRCPND